MNPSIGRIVIYNHPGSADGKFPPTQSPAIIQKVNYEDLTIDIWVFGDRGFALQTHIRQNQLDGGAEPSTWDWPTKV